MIRYPDAHLLSNCDGERRKFYTPSHGVEITGSRMKNVDSLSRYPVMIICNDALTSKLKNHKKQMTTSKHRINAFTKFTWLYPFKTVSAESALEKLKLQQKTFGNPIRIISDRGLAFTSKLFNDHCTEENIASSKKGNM
ncbi:pro-Pol polyprotein [Trichonephila inaurata madagascariensis]|uniref:Pro-Pol polyprotein n=1 Tax=Trichonephila inaurata madagascariensis TaxID=2747483 RepID=A0A8X7BSL4_9ARAC|nr:pro-Pol polyprotein [Trichonephila inaurata madagascariensis]